MPPARRSAPTTSAACSARRTCSTPVPGTRPARSTTRSCAAIEDEAIADVVRMQAGRRPADGDRRRVPPRLVAHGLHLRDRRHHARSPTRTSSCTSRTPTGAWTTRRPACTSTARCAIDEPIFGAGLRVPAVGGGRGADAEADDPVAVDGPLPRRARPRSIRRSTPTRTPFWDALSAAYSQQVRGIAAQGCTYLQFDDTSLAYLNDPQQRAELAAQGRDAEHLHERYIRQINAALAGRPGVADRHHPHVPRQLPLLVGRRGRLRLRRRGAVRRARGRRLLPRVRRRPLRRLRAAALRARRASGSSSAW